MRGLGRIALGLGLVGAALTAVVLMVLGGVWVKKLVNIQF